jgi:hypothetical protein
MAQRWIAVNDTFQVFAAGYPVITAADRLAVDLLLDPETAARKVRALAAQVTQTAGLIDAMGIDEYTAWVSEESFVEHHRSALSPASA